MKKSLRIIAVAVAPVPIVAAVVIGNMASASPQPMVAIPHNVNPAIAHSTRMGDMSANSTMSVAVSLKLHDEAGLQQFLGQVNDPKSSLYHQYLTPAEFSAKYGPTTDDVAKVTGFLTSAGLHVKDVSANRQVVDVTGSSAQVDSAFATHIANYKQGAREYYANETAPTLPADVANVVEGVAGLDNHAVRHTYNAKISSNAVSSNARTGSNNGSNSGSNNKANRKHRKPAAGGPIGGFEPSQLQSAYDTGSLGDASGQSVALWEFDGYQASNISTYDSQFGINTSAPQTVSVDGANYDNSPGQGQGEVELDIEIVQAMANAANTFVYEAPNSDTGQVDMANQIVSDDKVSVTSISWGECEAAASSSAITSTDNALQQGAAEGISFYSASGDSGSDDCGNGSDAVDYPASDPNVSGVGGTSLTANNGYGSETAWNGSGGGKSAVFDTPSYQNDSSGKRAVPDVSSDADPNTGYAIFSAGQWTIFGGTSCAAPMWAGFTALYDAKAGSNLGNGNSKFYAIGAGANYGSAFHDVTSGSNGGFNAATGYDPVTGWGSYDGAGLAAALSAN